MKCNYLTRIFSTDSNELFSTLSSVKERIRLAVLRRNPTAVISEQPTHTPRLVCVGKTKPASTIASVYNAGQRHFGENYVKEMIEKSHGLQAICPEIKWHYIGQLQSNKVRKLLGCPNLFMIETIESEKLADRVNSLWSKNEGNPDSSLNVMVQVNTSNEEQKSGVSMDRVCDIVQHIMDNCKSLRFVGLMTIGRLSHDYTTGPNPDFTALLKCKQDVMEKFSLQSDDVELSMGMSNDFEQAIEMGSTNIRVGSTIFGAREYAARPVTSMI